MRRICPECGEAITRLLESGMVNFDMELFEDGYDAFMGDTTSGGFRCPVCTAVLFEDKRSAIDFLRGD